jgi:acetolactate synthase-1/2/3 large subunit
MKLTGAEILIECLKREGVKTIFALPGGVVLKIFDMLHQQKDIEVVLTRHEQGAGHMAEGYAKATGKAGVCLVTSGPGMTNVITALADAYMDSVPLVCFSGQVPTSLIGNDAFQEADNVGLSRPCTKYNFLGTSRSRVGRYSKRCVHGEDGIHLSEFHFYPELQSRV